MAAVELISAPKVCPPVYEAEVAKIHKDVDLLMTYYEIPYFVQAGLAKEGMSQWQTSR